MGIQHAVPYLLSLTTVNAVSQSSVTLPRHVGAASMIILRTAYRDKRLGLIQQTMGPMTPVVIPKWGTTVFGEIIVAELKILESGKIIPCPLETCLRNALARCQFLLYLAPFREFFPFAVVPRKQTLISNTASLLLIVKIPQLNMTKGKKFSWLGRVTAVPAMVERTNTLRC